ncbi:MAG: F0F1 ATP synthase subunit gamma [Rhodospirillaceae bacterium]|jgi:F-type H+-transporting ATPase subunit gamma|nr:F0F1 ATP synthase subunit gamma [Rhodospirillaceae bacterium]MBT3491818.1 F0F1 ATP synthase subunit gamma [Rhodospirillaceae bacterium]MBT3783126.1 F0F1 ATP synthase subunit gamma [Rhodospirillaceae bacterium]MBT3978122.1 F0F1 ATP synthase subunit gamma [Rhodospirillaceae bacterium]MBT4167730.1 F0F1 ATP synthase subunit gamma [Rhodospirillaceae bacterium]
MANLKELKNRITSVTSTQKITKAMQMVAAAKLRRAQEAAEQSRPYADRMERMIASVASNLPSLDTAPPLVVGSGKDDVHLLVVVTAERGLCGAFNSSIVRAVRKKAKELQDAGKTVKLFCVGRKGEESLRRDMEDKIVEYVTLREFKNLSFANARPIAEKLSQMFNDGEFDVCTVYYNAFKSVISQVVTAQQLIPVKLPDPAEVAANDEDAPDLGGAIYDYEPEENDLLGVLVPRNMSVQIYRSLLESGAAEHAARMTSMDNATRNAGDMIDGLTLTYNRTRQAIITKELIEIVSGAEAL